MVHVQFRAGPKAARAARMSFARLTERVPRRASEDARLLISELVTNCVRHAGLGPNDVIDLRMAIREDVLRVEVRDRGPGFEPRLKPPTVYQVSGWGLFLVDRIADRWGVSSEGATCVWFELRLGRQRLKDRPVHRKQVRGSISPEGVQGIPV